MAAVSNLFDRRAKCTNFKLVGGQIEMPKASRRKGMGRGCPLLSRLGDVGEHRKLPQQGAGWTSAENEFWRILELEKTHLIDTNLSS